MKDHYQNRELSFSLEPWKFLLKLCFYFRNLEHSTTVANQELAFFGQPNPDLLSSPSGKKGKTHLGF
jgi:hypothetical protein